MPRNFAGNYTLPAGNPVVAGTTIDASWANDTMSDLANEITNSLSRNGEGGMLAAFRVADGTVSAPGLAFTNETNSGIYRAGTGELWLAVGGVAVAQITGNGLLIPSGKRIALPAPVNDTDAANKVYVDDLVEPVIGYADFYLGPKSSDPTLNNSGGALTAGTTYWSTTLSQMRVYNGTIWEPMPSTASLQGQTFSGTGAQTAFTLAAPTGNATNLEVFISGVRQVPTNDYTVSGTTLTFVAAPPSGTNNIYVRFAQLIALASADSSNVSFLQSGTGASSRTVQSKLRDVVSVLDFGADPTGVADSTTAIQAAVNTGKAVFLPKGVYKLTAPITLSTVGQRLFGESQQDTYLTGGTTHDLVRIAASHCEVDHIHFRPDGYSDAGPPTFAPLRIYAALAHVHDNRFLAASSGHGTAIFCDDVNPATSAIISGAYIHTIANNQIGASSYDFKYSIFCYNTNNGMQATRFQNNQILGDVGIYVAKGGGNYYVGNLLQSATGTYSVGVGNGIDFQSDVVGETVTGNYIERYNYGVIVRRSANDYLAANVFGNHWDNNNANFYSTGTAFYRFMDDESMTVLTDGWKEDFNSQDNFKFYSREGVEVYNINRANYSVEPRVLGHNLFQTLGYTANAQTKTPTASWCEITGSGAARTGCFLGNGTRTGQHLYLRAHTWSVQILNNPGGTQNVMFAGGAASATFGQSGNVGTMHLIWDGAYGSGMWFEVARTLA